MIEEYHFGSITINGKTYSYDVEVKENGEVLRWWRKESHIIDTGDVERAVEESPGIIVIGTGEAGIAKVTEEAQNFIQAKRIKLIIDKTGEAVKTFNIILAKEKQKKVIGLFHLTC